MKNDEFKRVNDKIILEKSEKSNLSKEELDIEEKEKIDYFKDNLTEKGIRLLEKMERKSKILTCFKTFGALILFFALPFLLGYLDDIVPEDTVSRSIGALIVCGLMVGVFALNLYCFTYECFYFAFPQAWKSAILYEHVIDKNKQIPISCYNKIREEEKETSRIIHFVVNLIGLILVVGCLIYIDKSLRGMV